jgi:hypothetical protein
MKACSLSLIILLSKAETDTGTESGAASEETLPNFGGGCCCCWVAGPADGARTMDAGRAGAESGKVTAPPDCTTAISSRREVAASSLENLGISCS